MFWPLRRVQYLHMAVFPSKLMKVQIVSAMVVALLGSHFVDRLSVRQFHPELHRARKARPPLSLQVCFPINFFASLFTLVFQLIRTRRSYEILKQAVHTLWQPKNRKKRKERKTKHKVSCTSVITTAFCIPGQMSPADLTHA